MSGEPDILYHYCSNETFLSIVKNKTIRLSDIGKSNDYMETKWLLEYFEQEVIRQYQEKAYMRSGSVIYGLNDIDTIKFLVKNEKNKILKRTDDLFYVACFSENGDKLSQWRGYADDGYGVSIGFNSDALKRLSEKDELLKLSKVIYPIEDVPNEISAYANKFLSSIYEVISDGDTKNIFFNDYSSDGFLTISTTVLLQDSIFFKNPAFIEEQEWRLVLNDELSKSSTEWEYWYDNEVGKPYLHGYFADRFPKGLQFKSSRNKIISFFDFTFKGIEDEIIEKIIIGPKSDVDEDDIYQILRYYGYQEQNEIAIEKSKSTYR